MTFAPMLLVAAGGIAAGAFLLVWALMPAHAPSLLEQRLGDEAVIDAHAAIDPDAAILERPFLKRVVEPMLLSIGVVLVRRMPTHRVEQLRKRLVQAGSSQRPETILALEVLAVPIGAGAGIAISSLLTLEFPLSLGASTFLAFLGYMLPSSLVKQQAKKRAKEIRRALPGVLDLLTISMEAGLSFDAAVMRVAESEHGALAVEFQKVLNEFRLGRPRLEALEALAERNNVEELTNFIIAVVQAEPLGVSVANVLRIQSEELRRLRRQRAEQAGHRAPVLMLLPMLGCIFPCIFVMLLGPAIIEIVTASH
ncbi:MAG: type II secretion system F family protein [Candidatus Dormibacteria bacterium]